MSEKTTATLEDRIAALKAQRGEWIAADDVAGVVAALVSSIEEENATQADAMRHEVRELLDFIARAKDELASMRPRTLADRHIASARDELDAVIAHTEAAADRIMDVGERLGDLANGQGAANGEELAALSTEIYEASTFQDITGQRVTKVMGVLRHIEERLTALAEVIGDDEVEEEEVQVFDESGEVVNAEALKHGPQLDTEANSQDDIDALLASFD
ncbi:MAG: hypothetical protein D6807_05720 [Alphaproteobacteria bacterium]|nr:MAG: hypothetical protein D6807_05720 [Alphaproteobacteria bacterium]